LTTKPGRRRRDIVMVERHGSGLRAAVLFAGLRSLSAGRTTFYILHRFSTVRQAERILLLKHGKVAEYGTHEELMAARGGYAELFTLQARPYLDELPS
jgi:ATP-binding cassette subfamily B protein